MIVNKMRRFDSDIFSMYAFNDSKVVVRLGKKSYVTQTYLIDYKIRGLVIFVDDDGKWYFHYLGRKILELEDRIFDDIELFLLNVKRTLVNMIEPEVETQRDILLILRYRLGYAVKMYYRGKLIDRTILSSYKNDEMPDAIVVIPDEDKMITFRNREKMVSKIKWKYMTRLIENIRDSDPIIDKNMDNILQEFRRWWICRVNRIWV